MRPRHPSLAVAILAATVSFPLSLPVAATTPPDLTAGEASYTKCVGCHSPAYNRTGPLHCGLLGRKSGTVRGYDYSPAMRAAGLTWDSDTLERFLAAPLAMLPGTTMGFAGIFDDEERRNLVAWLATLNRSSELCRNVLPAANGNEQ